MSHDRGARGRFQQEWKVDGMITFGAEDDGSLCSQKTVARAGWALRLFRDTVQ